MGFIFTCVRHLTFKGVLTAGISKNQVGLAGEIAWIQLTDICRGVMIRHIFSAKVIDYLSTQSAAERGSGIGFEAKSPFTII